MKWILLLLVTFQVHASDLDLATQALKQSSGRIIRVIYGPQFINIDNICSATLVGPSSIITASHCFYRNPDEQAQHPEKFYFDIDGVTSSRLSESLLKLSDKDENIRGANIVLAKNLLKKMPEILRPQIHPRYIASAETAYANQTSPEAEHDVATADLASALKVRPITLTEYIDGETVFIGGYPGKFLSGKQKVIECISGKFAKQYLIEKLESSDTRTAGRRKKSSSSQDNKNLKLANYEKYHQTAVLNTCNDTIVRGFSGGPQVVVRNQKVYLVAVTSQMFESMYGLAGDKILGAKVLNLQNFLAIQ